MLHSFVTNLKYILGIYRYSVDTFDNYMCEVRTVNCDGKIFSAIPLLVC